MSSYPSPPCSVEVYPMYSYPSPPRSEEVYPMSSYRSPPRSEDGLYTMSSYPYLLVVRSCGGKRTRLTSS